jgi:hypothetical protein
MAHVLNKGRKTVISLKIMRELPFPKQRLGKTPLPRLKQRPRDLPLKKK